MIIKVEVTPADINNAVLARQASEWVAECCPVAQALKRMFPGRCVHVGYHLLYMEDKTFAAVKPAEMDAFTIPDYRHWRELQPGSFEVTDSHATQG